MPSSLALAVGRGAIRKGVTLTVPQYKRAKTAMALGQFAWRNRAAIMKTGARMKRFYRAKRDAQTYLGRRMEKPEKRGVGVIEERTVLGNAFAYRQFNSENLTLFPDNVISRDGRRMKNFVNLTGIKYCFHFRSTVGYPSHKPVHIHFAIVQIKNEGDRVNPSNLKTDFFSDRTQLNLRTSDFVDAINGDPFDLKYECAAMNRDKMHILTHTKKTLWPLQTNVTEMGNTGVATKFEKYMHLKKRLDFNQMDDVIPEHPIYAIWWVTAKTAAEVPTASQAQNNYQFNSWIKLYYKV